MKLSPKQAKVLAVCQHDALMSVKAIAHAAKIREHSVTYVLHQLLSRRIVKPFMLFNLHALGLTDFCIFIGQSGEGKRARQKILDYCVNSPQAAYVGEVSGDYQFAISVFARSVFEVERFLGALSKHVPRAAFRMNFAIRAEWVILPRRYLCNSVSMPPALIRGEEKEEVAIDAVDHKILTTLGAHPTWPIARIAKQIQVPESTVIYRVKQLRQKRVILAFPYHIEASAFEMYAFRFLIITRTLDPTLATKLLGFVSSHRYGAIFVRCVGAWNFEMIFQVNHPQEGTDIFNEIFDQFGSDIQHMHVLTELDIHKTHHFPAEACRISSGD